MTSDADAALTPRQRRMLGALQHGSATLAGLRAALPLHDPHAVALPSMGEEDPFGVELTGLIERGWVAEVDGWYTLVGSVLTTDDATTV